MRKGVVSEGGMSTTNYPVFYIKILSTIRINGYLLILQKKYNIDT